MALHAMRLVPFFLFFFLLAANASPIPPSQSDQPANDSGFGWSKEAIFGLVSVFVALVGIVITIMVSKKMRRNMQRQYLPII
jgi:hypothetical protein